MHGLLLIDKPAGITSHDVVDKVRRIAQTRTVGHAGTLDPFATGLLILGVNQATKWLTGLVGLDKTYEATVLLGSTTDTFDTEGQVTSTYPQDKPVPTQDEIDRTLGLFTGEFDQKAPLFSAKKIKGEKLYDLARAGKATEEMRPVKRVTMHELSQISYEWPILKLRVHCSSGTYIRTLADDIGRALGTGGHLTALRRTSIGAFGLDKATPLAELIPEKLESALLSKLDNLA